MAIHVGQLCAAIRGNDLETTAHLLSHGANINEYDAFGRTPIFFARSPEMAIFLFRKGALIATEIGANEVQMDSEGRTLLHFLLGITAPNLIRTSKNIDETIHEIEQTTYIFLRAHTQEVGAGFLRNRTPLETKTDRHNNLPVTYLHGAPWSHNFIERIGRDHLRNYRHLPSVLQTPWIETPQDYVFGRSLFFTGRGSY